MTMKNTKPRELNFILGNSRCGTNPLGRILTQCGADFGDIDAPVNVSKDYWNKKEKARIGGYMEDKLIGRSANYFKKYYQLRNALPFVPVKLISFIRLSGAKVFRKRMMSRKWICHNAILPYLDDVRKLCNVKPKIIGLVRHPIEQINSFYTGFGTYISENEPTKLYTRYFDRNTRLISHVEKYGGTIICWDDLINPKKINWANSIVREFPEFKVKDLLAARKKVINVKISRNKGKRKNFYLPEEYKKFWKFLLTRIKEYEQ